MSCKSKQRRKLLESKGSSQTWYDFEMFLSRIQLIYRLFMLQGTKHVHECIRPISLSPLFHSTSNGSGCFICRSDY